MLLIVLALLVLCAQMQKICDGNKFEFVSTYSLGRQAALTNTF